MIEEVKFCKDCKHYRAGQGGMAFLVTVYVPEQCAANKECDLVSGRPITWDPRNERRGDGHCGPHAKLWQPKPEPESAPAPEPESFNHLSAPAEAPGFWQSVFGTFL